MSHVGHALSEVGDEPVEILHLAGGLTHCVPLSTVIPPARDGRGAASIVPGRLG
jgi:hypothetical protein